MEPKQKQYLVTASQLQDIMKYLMTRPYAEVVTIMNSLASLVPFEHKAGEKDNGKK